MEAGDAQTIGGQLVEVGRGDFTAESTDIGKAHIVGNDQQYVGACWRGCGMAQRRQRCQKHQQMRQQFPRKVNLPTVNPPLFSA